MELIPVKVDPSVQEHADAVAEASINWDAVRAFRRHMPRSHPAWDGLTVAEVKEDILTADWVPNRAAWRRRGFRNYAHAQAVLGG